MKTRRHVWHVSPYFLSLLLLPLGSQGVPPPTPPSLSQLSEGGGGVTPRVIGQFIAGPHRRQTTISAYADVHFLLRPEVESVQTVNCDLVFGGVYLKTHFFLLPSEDVFDQRRLSEKCGPHGGAKGIIKKYPWPQRGGIDPLTRVSAVCITIDPAGVSTGGHTDPKWTFTAMLNLQRWVKIATKFPRAVFIFAPSAPLENTLVRPSISRSAFSKGRDAQGGLGVFVPFVASLQASSVCVSLRLCLLTPRSTPALPSILEPLLHPDSESVCHGGQRGQSLSGGL